VNDTTVTSSGPLGALFCTLYGNTVPFTTDELKSLYRSHADYVGGVIEETNRLLDQRFLQRWNARTIIYNAKESFIPTAHSDDLDDGIGRDDHDRRSERGHDGDGHRWDHDFDADDF
jgi:hypothetical protein